MGKLKRLSLLIILFGSSALCFAKQLSFQIVQHDDSAKEVTEQSLIIEDEVLNTFFDYGFIVTNSNAAISASKTQDEKLFKTGVGDAFNGFSDYFIQINLFFVKDDKSISDAADLKQVKFSITAVKTGETLVVQSFDNIKGTNQKDDLKKISADLVLAINKALKSKKA